MIASFVLLTRAARDLPIGSAYAVWVGIGAVGATVLGVVIYGEPMSPARGLFLGLVVLGILGLKITTPA